MVEEINEMDEALEELVKLGLVVKIKGGFTLNPNLNVVLKCGSLSGE